MCLCVCVCIYIFERGVRVSCELPTRDICLFYATTVIQVKKDRGSEKSGTGITGSGASGQTCSVHLCYDHNFLRRLS